MIEIQTSCFMCGSTVRVEGTPAMLHTNTIAPCLYCASLFRLKFGRHMTPDEGVRAFERITGQHVGRYGLNGRQG